MTTMTETKRPRGRPRPQETIDRDNAILASLTANGPQTRNALAEELGAEKTQVYLSLSRLREQGLVRTCAQQGGPGTLWSANVEQPCP